MKDDVVPSDNNLAERSIPTSWVNNGSQAAVIVQTVPTSRVRP